MFSSLQTRLMVAVSAVALAAVTAVALSARLGTRTEFRKFQELELRQSHRPTVTAAQAARELAGRCCEIPEINRAAAGLAPGEALVVLDEAGRLIAAAGPGVTQLRDLHVQLVDDVLRVDAVRTGRSDTSAITLQFRGPPAPRITRRDGGAAAIHVITMPSSDPIAPAAAFLGSVDRRLLAVTSLVGALALGITWTLARRIVRPIDELGQAARDLAHGDLSRRVATTGSDEVAALARSFNAMAAELERQQMLRRSLVHDVTHELRTPLTALRCRLETMLDGLAVQPQESLTAANEEVRHLSRLVDDLQELASAEAHELRLSIGDMRVADVAQSAVRAAGLEQDPRLRVEIDPSLAVSADALRVRQIMLNLLTNADRHTPPNGAITVQAAPVDGAVAIVVHNTGSSLEAGQLQRIFDRFYRGDPARQRATGGTGLGLAIVKHLIEAQGGRVSAVSDDDGVAITVTLPAAANQP